MKYIEIQIERVFGLSESDLVFQENSFYRKCWSKIVDAFERNHKSDFAVLASHILESFASKLSRKSRDYRFYCRKLLVCLDSAASSGQCIHSSSLACLQSYLKFAEWDILRDLFDQINHLCFYLVSRSSTLDPCGYNLGAIGLWQVVLTKGLSSKFHSIKHSNLTLIFAQVQKLSISDEEVVQKAAMALLDDLMESYKCMDCTDNCAKLDDSKDLIDLEGIEEFDDENEVEYFLRGSLAHKHDSSKTKKGVEMLKHNLLQISEYLPDVFNNREISYIERAISEGVECSFDSDLPILECISAKFLEITYEELTAIAQESIKRNRFQLKRMKDLNQSCIGPKSAQKKLELYKDNVIVEADSIEAKFLLYVAPRLKNIIDNM